MTEKNKKMPEIVQIRRGKISKYQLSQHVEYYRQQYALVAERDAQKLHLGTEMLKEWKACIELEEDLNKESQLSIRTDELKKKDRERSMLLRQIFGLVKAQSLSQLAPMYDAAVKIGAAIHTFYGTQQGAGDEKTADIVGLIAELENLPTESAAVGLTPAIEQLKTANQAYEKLHLQRSAEKVSTQLPASHKVRRRTDELFFIICRNIEAAYLFAASEKDRSMVFNLVELMNYVTHKSQASYNQGLALKRASKEKKAAARAKTDTPAYENTPAGEAETKA